jgi:hypothetical protein
MKRIVIMLVIQVVTNGKSFTTHEKKMELFNKYTLLRFINNLWHDLSQAISICTHVAYALQRQSYYL